MHLVLVNRLESLSLLRNSVIRFTDRLDMATPVYHGRQATTIPLREETAGSNSLSPAYILFVLKIFCFCLFDSTGMLCSMVVAQLYDYNECIFVS